MLITTFGKVQVKYTQNIKYTEGTGTDTRAQKYIFTTTFSFKKNLINFWYRYPITDCFLTIFYCYRYSREILQSSYFFGGIKISLRCSSSAASKVPVWYGYDGYRYGYWYGYRYSTGGYGVPTCEEGLEQGGVL